MDEKLKGLNKDDEVGCVIDIMLEAEVYKNDLTKMSNDLLILIIGALDTSRSTIVTLMAS